MKKRRKTYVGGTKRPLFLALRRFHVVNIVKNGVVSTLREKSVAKTNIVQTRKQLGDFIAKTAVNRENLLTRIANESRFVHTALLIWKITIIVLLAKSSIDVVLNCYDKTNLLCLLK